MDTVFDSGPEPGQGGDLGWSCSFAWSTRRGCATQGKGLRCATRHFAGTGRRLGVNIQLHERGVAFDTTSILGGELAAIPMCEDHSTIWLRHMHAPSAVGVIYARSLSRRPHSCCRGSGDRAGRSLHCGEGAQDMPASELPRARPLRSGNDLAPLYCLAPGTPASNTAFRALPSSSDPRSRVSETGGLFVRASRTFHAPSQFSSWPKAQAAGWCLAG